MCKRIPEMTMKWISAAVFVLFGLAGIYDSLDHRIGTPATLGLLAGIAAATAAAAYFIARRSKPSSELN